jgi:hypothetical protein
VRGRFEAALPQVAELARGALRAEEDDLVFFFVVVARDKVGLPAASLRIGRTPAFAADEPGGKHGNDDAAARRRPKVAGQDMAFGDGARRTCEHLFVTSQGSASGRFQRACDRGQVQQAEMAAREMGRLSLIHALSLVTLYARTGSPKFEPAAVRWLARLALEGREIRLNELQLAAAALACLRGRKHERAEKTLLRLL